MFESRPVPREESVGIYTGDLPLPASFLRADGCQALCGDAGGRFRTCSLESRRVKGNWAVTQRLHQTMKVLLGIFLSTTLVAAPDLARCTFLDGSPMVLKKGEDLACIGYAICSNEEAKIKNLNPEHVKYDTFLCSIPMYACRNDRLTANDMIPLITFAKDCRNESKGGAFNLERSPNAPK